MSHPASKRPLLNFPSYDMLGPQTLTFNSERGPTVIT